MAKPPPFYLHRASLLFHPFRPRAVSKMYSSALVSAFMALASSAIAAPAKRWDCSSDDHSRCSLASLAEQSGKYFGTAYQSFYLADPNFEPALNSQFDQYTPENEMKWEVIQPSEGVYNWTGGDLVSHLPLLDRYIYPDWLDHRAVQEDWVPGARSQLCLGPADVSVPPCVI